MSWYFLRTGNAKNNATSAARGSRSCRGSKGQHIVAALLIVVITIALVAVAYTWGLPLIRKRQEAAKMSRLSNYFGAYNENSLMKKIEYVANNGGEETFTMDVDGWWVLHEYTESSSQNNSIEFDTFSRESTIAVDAGWISSGESCPPEKGGIGTNNPWVVCARADTSGEGFDIKYGVWFRELEESSAKGYVIRLIKNPSGPLSSTGSRVRVSRERVYTDTSTGKTLIITEIKILLE